MPDRKVKVRTVLEVLQQEIDFHKDGVPKISMPDPRYAAGYLKGLEQARELVAKIAEVEYLSED